MSKKPSIAQTMALKAAAAVAAVDEPEAAPTPEPVVEAPSTSDCVPDAPVGRSPATKAKGGRPRGRREIAGRQTVHLDEKRLAALQEMAEDRGRSIHSLIIEGIDAVIGRPVKTVWK